MWPKSPDSQSPGPDDPESCGELWPRPTNSPQVQAHDTAEIERGIATFSEQPNGGLIVLADPLAIRYRDLIIGLAAGIACRRSICFAILRRVAASSPMEAINSNNGEEPRDTSIVSLRAR